MLNNKGIVIVLYYTRGIYPLRTTISDHLYCFKDFGNYPVIYINVAFGFPWNFLKGLPIKAVIFHTLFLSMRWSLDIFNYRTAQIMPLKDLGCLKLAIPQDEFIHTEQLSRFLKDINITHIFSCAEESEWEKIYLYQSKEKVRFKQVLTGYLSDKTVKMTEKIKKTGQKRAIDIGYRAWEAAYWLGKHGRLKVEFANQINNRAPKNLKVDISLSDSKILNGLDWFRFLLECKSVIGVEGGSSILDSRGEIKKQVDEYLKLHPKAPFDQVWNYCLKDHENSLNLKAISPRHLEACLTETCQVLIEGNYNNVLHPWKHYIPVRKDYGNIEEALELMQDENLVEQITKTAYKDVVLSQNNNYQAFVKLIEENYLHSNNTTFKINLKNIIYYYLLRCRDNFHWFFIWLECKALNDKKGILKFCYDQMIRFGSKICSFSA